MIPKSMLSNKEIEFKTQPSKNYKMYMGENVINGSCDGLEAMRQVIYKILNTERYRYAMYSWNYGTHLNDLFGEPVDLVCAEIERRISEALTCDDRISLVDSFSFDISEKRKVHVIFTVHTIFGDIQTGKEVSY